MSLMNKFSVTYNLDRASKKKKKSQMREPSSFTNNNKKVLTKEVAEGLISLGYELEAIVLLSKIHFYSNIDEALNLLSKDPEKGMYNHKFSISDKGQEKSQYQNANDKCFICKGIKNEHLDDSYFDAESNKIELLDKSKEHNPMTTPNDVTVQPLVQDTPSLLRSSTETKPKDVIEYKKIEIPEETLILFESPDICRICFAEKQNPKNIAQITCGHFFCDTCIGVHLTTKIINGRVLDIKCLLGGCPKKYTNEEIKANVTQDVYLKFKKFYNEQFKLNSPNKVYVNCPFPDCEEIVDCDNCEDDFVECDKKHLFCFKCRSLKKHKKGKCQNEDVILMQQIKNSNGNAVNYKQCPNCRVIIEKNEGCNQMHCINCQYSFCWLCMKKYTEDHYAMYNVGGCPGMRYENDSKSKWRRNPVLKFFWYFLSCFLGFWVLILILLFYLLFGCSYEFVKCYQKKKKKKEEEDSVDYEYNYDVERSHNESSYNENQDEQENQKKNWGMIIFIGFLGFLCQPFYLTFYLLYGLMECYRRFNCWFYYVDY